MRPGGARERPFVVSAILLLNKVFRRPRVGGRESEHAYSRWEHHWGRELTRTFLEPAGDLNGKIVLDVGCGLGGKTVAYDEAGAACVVGTDILVDNTAASALYARDNSAGRPAFLTSDVAALPFADEVFDTVIANDAMEHFSRPEEALAEMHRVTKRGGAVWIFFTPHYSPLGSHLYDYIYTPWCHLLFSRAKIERAIARILEERPAEKNGDTRAERLEKIMKSYDQDLNHMSVRRFLRIVKEIPSLRVSLLKLQPAKFGFLAPLTRVPLLRELFTGFVVCRAERTG